MVQVFEASVLRRKAVRNRLDRPYPGFEVVTQGSPEGSRAAVSDLMTADSSFELLLSASFEPFTTAAPVARHRVRNCLADRQVSAGVLASALRVASELVANAIIHAATPFRLSISAQDQTIRIAVADGKSRPAESVESNPDAAGGHGLRIVESLATRWGQTPIPGDGKVVWAELDQFA
jgi:hypothetical protein